MASSALLLVFITGKVTATDSDSWFTSLFFSDRCVAGSQFRMFSKFSLACSFVLCLRGDGLVASSEAVAV